MNKLNYNKITRGQVKQNCGYVQVFADTWYIKGTVAETPVD
jgi:hypothetical protein